MANEIDSILPSTTIHPFPEIHTVHYSELEKCRKAFVECPICFALDDFYSRSKQQKFDPYYCPGNAPPECYHTDQNGKVISHPVVCAGITEKHFHVKCFCCGSEFLVAMPEAK